MGRARTDCVPLPIGASSLPWTMMATEKAMTRKCVAELFGVTNTSEKAVKKVHFKAAKADRSNNGAASRRPQGKRKIRTTSAATVLGLKTVTQERLQNVGLLTLHLTLLIFLPAYLSPKWVCRVFDPSELLSGGADGKLHVINANRLWANVSAFNKQQLYCFGVWTACLQTGRCDDIWKIVPGVNKVMVLWVQVLATIALLGYGCASLLDAASHLPLFVCLGYNRVVESILAPSAVVHFLALLYQTGQVKNQALRVHSLRDQAAWGLALSGAALALALTSVCVLALFRLPPSGCRRRRFWKMPVEFRPRAYLAGGGDGSGGGLGRMAVKRLPRQGCGGLGLGVGVGRGGTPGVKRP